ncbi:MAG TPA: HD domain-containing protein [Anaerolineae bacterium]|jgi:(p)ppGpp synthase/HD superfamily hydrolase
MAFSPLFEEALVYAAQLHAQQWRKGTQIPYVGHVLGVCSIAIEYGADEDEAIAALLHDGPEDQGGIAVLNNIRKRFGSRVAEIVEGCSDTFEIPKPPWRARKEAYIAHLPFASQSIRLVSAADKLYNARAILNDWLRIGDLIWSRFNGGKDGTLWYYRALVVGYQTQSEAQLNPLVDELNRVVTELERVAG